MVEPILFLYETHRYQFDFSKITSQKINNLGWLSNVIDFVMFQKIDFKNQNMMKYLSIDDGATLDIQLNNMFIVIQSCCYLL